MLTTTSATNHQIIGADLQEFIDLAPIGIFTSTPDGRYISANPALAGMLGYDSPEELIASTTDISRQIYVDAEDRKLFTRLLETHGEVINHESRFRRRDGTEFWASRNARAVRDKDGHIIAYQGFTTDITDRKRAEKGLLKSETILKDILESTLSGYWDWNLVENTEYLSPAFKRMFGYEDHEMESSPEAWQKIIFPEDLPAVLEIFDRHVKSRGREPFYNVVRYRHRDDSTVWVICAGRVIEWATDGTPVRMVGCHVDITNLKQTEEALRRSENLFRKVFEILPVGLWIADKNGKLMQGNPAGVAIWGAEPNVDQQEYGVFNAKRLPSGEEIAPNDWALVHTVNKGETIVDELLEIEAFDGKKKIILNYSAPVLDKQGKVEAAIIVNHDITSRYQAEEALRESEERFRLSMDATNDGVWDWDIQTDQVYYSPGYARMLGYESTDIPTHVNSWLDLIHPDDREEAFKRNFDCIENRIESFAVEFRMQSRDGAWKWILGRGRAASRDASGRAIRMIGTHQDITERKRAEDALRESEARFRNLFEHVPTVAVQGYGMDGTILFWNKAAETIYGYTPNEALGKNLCDLIIPAEMRPEVVGEIKKMTETGIPAPAAELILKRKDGSRVPVFTSHAIFQIPGSSPELICIDVDLTELKQTEQALLQAQKMESLGILAGGVAHDFNNLLQAMGGNIELLLQGKPSDHPDATRLQNVAKSINHAAQLVRQLLLFGRKAESRKARVNLNHEVQEAVRILERTIPKMIALELHLDPSVWPLLADSVQIEQILLNLAGNAVDAMPEGGKLMVETSNTVLDEAFIRLHPGASAGPHVLLTVTDTGSGMDKEVLEHVFDPFYTTKEVGKGTGLGLASVYGIVKSHGGHIQCYSEPGNGTTFKVFWPAERGDEDLTEEDSQESSIEGGSETILVVDDDPQIRELTWEALKMLGYSVRMAVNGEQALEMYQEPNSPIDLVLLDLNMPGMGGHKCLKELLRFDPAVKVVISSGYSANGQGRDTMASGAKGFLGKPYQMKEMATIVRRVLDDHES
ncbi:PAS domain S-box-containing protein [Desulfonatronum thiosulfatophilum]|uniref:histidine kinase n=1 Tax=Desulfonatronum thiosulfatophilum TaxID=617002 RepID=A0A1G6C6R6_9BACT|nr:PAS domain S-box protein [Desulfonatronum thiosulfatophilum]SDB28576.1 PAS domain S-box-containing protein [Desulfonatronum thiosulfatophilum]